MGKWNVYMLRCGDNSLYTGITTDVDRRIEEHRNGTGSKYVRSRLPCEVVYVETGYDQSSALKREYEIKSFSKSKKESMIEDNG